MSIATDIEHQRAAWAWKQVEAVHHDVKDSYRVMIKTVPALISQSGLLAALAFLNTRTGANKDAANQVYEHLQSWLVATDKRRGGTLKDTWELLPALAEADTRLHRQRTDETMAIISWLRRFADVQHRE